MKTNKKFKRLDLEKNKTRSKFSGGTSRFNRTKKMFGSISKGIGKRVGLYKETTKEKMKKAVDELVKEIGKFNNKTKNYAQYGITDIEATQSKKKITDAFGDNIPVPRQSPPITSSTSQAIG
jgi:polyhydroxyalkanoate synthesis regulator phasin